MIQREFDCHGFHVQVWLNTFYQKYFWVTGKGPERFQGACEYFSTPDEAEQNARKHLKLLAKDRGRAHAAKR
jgi:hypothetical protein